MDEATRRLNIAFADIFRRMERENHDRMREDAQADPVKHKTTLIFPNNQEPQWRYWNGGGDRRGVRRRFCYTTNRNAAGYFLSFVDVWDSKKGRGERKDFLASKTRHLMKARAKRMYEAYVNRKRK